MHEARRIIREMQKKMSKEAPGSAMQPVNAARFDLTVMLLPTVL
jgi:hypothetical protein